MLRDARQPAKVASVMDAAVEFRRIGRAISGDDIAGHAIWQQGLEESVSEIVERYGPAVATAFEGIATGTATALQASVDSWLTEPGAKGVLNARTKDQRRAILNHLENWLQANRHPATIEAITPRVAGVYITDTFIGPGVHSITANSKISVLSSYWRWLGKRMGVVVNPWAGQSFRKPSKRMNGERTKRPFTREEMIALLVGPADQEVADAIRLAALSGMRLEELYRLKVADCAGGIFDVRQSKTDAGVRKVPIHRDLAAIVARRIEGKDRSDFLMHEGGKADGRERSAAISKRFGRYRQSVGAHDREDGRRHSRIDFHSLRRWFITEARKGFDRAVVAAVVGHESGNITDDVYNNGPDMDTSRKCVESVKLPDTSPPAVTARDRGAAFRSVNAAISGRPFGFVRMLIMRIAFLDESGRSQKEAMLAVAGTFSRSVSLCVPRLSLGGSRRRNTTSSTPRRPPVQSEALDEPVPA